MKDLAYRAPLALAIAEGATTPDPGTSGVQVFSSTTGRTMEWRDGAWHAVARVHVGTTAPSNPAVGDVWIDTN